MSPKQTILIADDDQDLLNVLELRCAKLGLEVVTAGNAIDALRAATEAQPDIICMDVELPGGNGLAAAEMFRSDDRFSDAPLIIITGNTDANLERRCHELPAYYIPKASDTWERLELLLRDILGLTKSDSHDCSSRPSSCCDTQGEEEATALDTQPSATGQTINRIEPGHSQEAILDSVFAILHQEGLLDDLVPSPQPWVLCIDDDQDFLVSLTRRLEARGIGVINAYDGIGGVHTAFTQPANAIILDYNMPNGQGDYVLQRLKELPSTKHIPVIILTGNKDDAVRRTLLSLGAEAFLYKPPVYEQLLGELERHINIPADNRG